MHFHSIAASSFI